ncbi:hypothetical protein HG531_002708 [Fusarium graminearum]|nr:hypothetical protein HG531_002708 [Fusarium graminearum]
MSPLGLASELGPLLLGSLNNVVLVVDPHDAGVVANGLRPLVKVWGFFFEARREIGGKKTVLGEGQCSNDERGSELIATTKERSSVLEKRFNLLDDTSYSIIHSTTNFFVRRAAVDGPAEMALDLARVGISKEADPGSDQGPVRVRRGREQRLALGRVSVDEELGDNGRFSDGLAVVDNGRDKTARVDLEIFWRAGLVEVDDLFFEGDV